MSTVKKIIIALILVLTAGIVVLAKDNNTVHDGVNTSSTIPLDFQFLSNKYTQMETDNRIAENEFINDTNYELIGTHNNLSLLYNKDDLGIIVVDNNTGYLWSSQIDSSYLFDEESSLHDEVDL